MSSRHGAFVLVVMVLATPALAAPADPGGLGSALQPMFSVQHAAMRPGETVTLVACVVQQNPDASRTVEPGDAFELRFLGGTLGSCDAVSVLDPSASFADADWQCDVAGSSLTMTYVGTTPKSWSPGNGACAELLYMAPDRPTSALTSLHVRRPASYRPPTSAALLLSVSVDIGSVGPQGERGPEGPTGPQGPRGIPMAGNVATAEATGLVQTTCDREAVIPGLDLTIDMSAGSRLSVDVQAHHAGDSAVCNNAGNPGVLHVELDGVVVASRPSDFAPSAGGTQSDLSWISPPLTAGTHRVRILIRCFGPETWSTRTDCYGTRTDDYPFVSRLNLVELRQE